MRRTGRSGPTCRFFSLLVELVVRSSNHRYDFERLDRAVAQAQKSTRPEPTGAKPKLHRLRDRLGQDTLDQIVADYLNGATSRTIAETHSIAKGTVIELVRAAGHQPRPRGPAPEQP